MFKMPKWHENYELGMQGNTLYSNFHLNIQILNTLINWREHYDVILWIYTNLHRIKWETCTKYTENSRKQ